MALLLGWVGGKVAHLLGWVGGKVALLVGWVGGIAAHLLHTHASSPQQMVERGAT